MCSLDMDKIHNNGEGFIADFPKDTVYIIVDTA